MKKPAFPLRSCAFVSLVVALAACGGARSSAAPSGPAAATTSASPSASAPAPALASAAAPKQAPIVISIVGTSDVHGHVESLPVLGAFVDALRTTRGADSVLLVDAGDMFQGTLESNLGEGAVMIRGYDALGYDAAAFGNHEFDFGPAGPHATVEGPGEDPQGALKARAAEAHFPLLAADVDDAATHKPIAWPNVHPSVTVTKHGVTIGLVGVTSEDTPHTTISANFAGLHIEPLASTIEREAGSLRRAGATVVVLLAHAGGDCRDMKDPHDVSSCDRKGEIMHVLEKMPAGTVDAVVAGHTHAAMAQFVNGVPVIQSYSVGKAFGRMDLDVDPVTKKVTSAHVFPPTHLKLPASYEGKELATPDARVASVIAPDVERARARKEEKLGVHLDAAITRSHGKESAEGNLFADLMRTSHPDADVAFTNGGGLRADLPAGDLTYGQLFEAMPFDNRFAVLKLTGKQLREVLTRNLKSDGGILSVSGVRVIATCGAGGALDVKLEREPVRRGKKKAIADDDGLVVVTSDFLATGGDSTGLDVTPTIEPMVIRDALERGLRAHGGALRPSDVLDTSKPRLAYQGERPVRCGP